MTLQGGLFMGKYVMVIDEGTTGTRALLFDKAFKIVSESYVEFTQYTPSEDKVEHDAEEIYGKTIQMCKQAIERAGAAISDIECIGITNQRATAVAWNRKTGRPLHNAIVWQDNRAARRCAELNAGEWGEKCKQKTGWVINNVYSSLMLEWMARNVKGAREQFESGDAIFGTIDTWLIWKLTGGRSHKISFSNASVTGSLDIHAEEWYREFLDYLGLPLSIFPSIVEDSGDYGETSPEIFGASIPITGSIADQHAALFAQGCKTEGTAKLTNGTGSFLDVNIGEKCFVAPGGINTVIAWKIKGKTHYAMEGYSAVTGSAVQWLRDGLGIIKSSGEIEGLARSVKDTNGLFFVPALTGLGAPYWDQFARGIIVGINRGTTKEHICRATLESIGYSIRDITEAIAEVTGNRIMDVSIDGGASKNNLLAQMLSDIIGANIHRPASVEATSLGAAQMAGLYTGFWQEKDFDVSIEYDGHFKPEIPEEIRAEAYSQWLDAVDRSKAWIKK
jgi:glycerol kinase